MCSHVAGLAEAEPTLGAGVRFDSRVIVHVRLQVMFLREGLAADGTRVRLDPRV